MHAWRTYTNTLVRVLRKSARAVLLVELSQVFLLPTKRKFTFGGGVLSQS